MPILNSRLTLKCFRLSWEVRLEPEQAQAHLPLYPFRAKHRLRGLLGFSRETFLEILIWFEIPNPVWKCQEFCGIHTWSKSWMTWSESWMNSPEWLRLLWLASLCLEICSVYSTVSHHEFIYKKKILFPPHHLSFSLVVWKILSIFRKHLCSVCDFQSPFTCIPVGLYSYMNPWCCIIPMFADERKWLL